MPEFPHKRQTIRGRNLARVRKGKKAIQVDSLKKLANKKGELIYTNPKAKPVNSIIRERWQRTPFSMENVEWISKDHLAVGIGGFSTVFFGKIKFKRVPSPIRVAIKQHKRDYEKKALPEIIKRLNKSGVAHPKMAYFANKFGSFIVMELFSKKENGIKVTKLPDNIELLHTLDLNTPSHNSLFKQAMHATAKLAKNGLVIRNMGGMEFPSRIDLFTTVGLKNGEQKLLIQDIDALQLSQRAARTIFLESGHNLVDTVNYKNSLNYKISNQIMQEVAKEFGFA